MSRLYTLIIITTIILQACNTKTSDTHINRANSKIIIDGIADDAAWAQTEWRPMDQQWLGEDYTAEDFSGKYKVLWDDTRLYVLAEIIDDTLIDIRTNGLDRYWDDDCLEIFVDQDASGGGHQFSYNAFAYHIGLDGRVVDFGADEQPHYYSHVHNARTTAGDKSIWEASIYLYDDTFQRNSDSQYTKLSDGHTIGFAIAYCDNDHSEERENFIGSIYVDGEDKNQGYKNADIFEKCVLVK